VAYDPPLTNASLLPFLSDVARVLGQLFDHGGWWRKILRPSVDYNAIPESFQSLCTNFPDLFHSLDTPEMHECMKLLTNKVDEVEGKARAKGDRTLLHGDFKTSNLFFHVESDDVGK